MKKSDFIKELEDIFTLQEGTINESSTLRELDVDSIGMLLLVTFFVNNIGIEVDIDELRKAQTIQDIITLTNGKVL
ncbi:MAG: phosphopantetheine-binding protein [Planctomycetaceae bacterium]|jgi:acyl carrier protein|nr:phosphopantetheine-binding protein [Planctomycetaceae bacterium]